jgi:hypothetical protein
MTRGLFLGILFVAQAASAQATSYTAAQFRYSTRDAIALLGPAYVAVPPRTLLFESDVQAGIKSTIHCGSLGVQISLGSFQRVVNNVPNMLVQQGGAILSALPMLTLCYTSPTLCAEVKNFNFQINEKIKGMTDLCKSMNDYINHQAYEGSVGSYAQAKAVNNCIQQAVANGVDLETATANCQGTPPAPLFTDIAQAWLADATTTSEQNILSAVLTASGQLVDGLDQDNYAFIGAVLGELKLDVNGKLLPVFPAHPMTAKGLAKQVEALAVGIACDQGAMTNGTQKPGLSPSQPDASARVYERALYSVLLQELNSQDVKSLFYLDAPDQQLSCNSLGRALARRVVDILANDTGAALATAFQNPAVPKDVQKIYVERQEAAFKAMRGYAADRSEKTIPEIRRIIATLAELKLKRTGAAARALNAGREDEAARANVECDDVATCSSAPASVPAP